MHKKTHKKLAYHQAHDWKNIRQFLLRFITPLVLLASTPLATSANPFSCSSEAYLFNAPDTFDPSDFFTLDLASGTLTEQASDFNSDSIDSVGYNTLDNYIWGFDNGLRKIVKIDKNLNKTVYDVPGLPDKLYCSGDVDKNGVMHIFGNMYSNSGDGKAFKIDLSSGTPVFSGELQLPSYDAGDDVADIYDWAFHPDNGKLYALSQSHYSLLEIDPATGNTTEILTGLCSNWSGGKCEIDGQLVEFDFHSIVFDDAGNLYFYGFDGLVFKIDLSDPANPKPPVYFSSFGASVVGMYDGDGARCPNAPLTGNSICGTDPVDIIVMNDESGSVSAQEFADSITFLTNLANGISNWGATGVNMRYMGWAGETYTPQDTGYQSSAAGFIAGLPSSKPETGFYDGGTDYNEFVDNHGIAALGTGRAGAKKIVLLITDSHEDHDFDNDASDDEFAASQLIKDTGATLAIIAVDGAYSNTNIRNNLEAMASPDGSGNPLFYTSANFTDWHAQSFIDSVLTGLGGDCDSSCPDSFLTLGNPPIGSNWALTDTMPSDSGTNSITFTQNDPTGFATVGRYFWDSSTSAMELSYNPGRFNASNSGDSTTLTLNFAQAIDGLKLRIRDITEYGVEVSAPGALISFDGGPSTDTFNISGEGTNTLRWDHGPGSGANSNNVLYFDGAIDQLTLRFDIGSFVPGFTSGVNSAYDPFFLSFPSDCASIVTGAISGTVFTDSNANDTHDTGETGLQDISVTLYSDINSDGSVDAGDTIVRIAYSDTNGDYSFSNLPDGNYLLLVDSSDTDLPAGLTLGGSNPLAVTLSGSDIADKDFPFDLPVCNAFSGEINNGLSPNLQLRSSDKVFLATTTVTANQREGHLKAYAVNNSGTVASTASWDAAEQMTTNERGSRLYSTSHNGNLILFEDLDSTDENTAAYATNGAPDAATIEAYTLNPSYDDDLYLNGRKSGSVLGPISPEASLGLVDNMMDTLTYLNDAAYRSFYKSTVATRSAETSASHPARVIVSSDDGFVYAFNQSDGDLGWGWMPRSLVQALKNHAEFQEQHYMQGKIDVLDLKDSSGNYASYVIGSYKQGLGQYVLKLTASGGLAASSLVWDKDYDVDSGGMMDAAPNLGERVYFSDVGGRVYAAFVVNDTDGNDSRLHIRSLTDSNTDLDIPLTFMATSTPFVMADFQSTTAPASKTLYLGSSTGDIYSAALLSSGSLRSSTDIQSDLSTSIAAMDTNATSPIRYIGASTANTDSLYYLRAQTDDWLTVFKYKSADASWLRKWSTYVGGAGTWSADGTTLTDASSTIQVLPADSTITANATIVANSIVLPVAQAPTGNACYGSAHYYFYKLPDGAFPTERFYLSDDSAIGDILGLGYGKPQKLQLMDRPTLDQLLGFGIAEQDSSNQANINAQLYIKDPITTGIRSWRELRGE